MFAGMFGALGGGFFDQNFRAYPVAFIEKESAEGGDKVILPPSSLNKLGAFMICVSGPGRHHCFRASGRTYRARYATSCARLYAAIHSCDICLQHRCMWSIPCCSVSRTNEDNGCRTAVSWNSSPRKECATCHNGYDSSSPARRTTDAACNIPVSDMNAYIRFCCMGADDGQHAALGGRVGEPQERISSKRFIHQNSASHIRLSRNF